MRPSSEPKFLLVVPTNEVAAVQQRLAWDIETGGLTPDAFMVVDEAGAAAYSAQLQEQRRAEELAEQQLLEDLHRQFSKVKPNRAQRRAKR